MSLAETSREPRGRTVTRAVAKVAPAPVKPLEPAKAREEEPTSEEVAACKEAADRVSCVVAGFARMDPAKLFKSTRGAAKEAFPRQLAMAGLVMELGFSSLTVGRAIGRDKATVDHACRVVEALRGGMEAHDLVLILGEEGCREYLDGKQLIIEYQDARGRIIDPERVSNVKGLTVNVLSGGDAVEEFITEAEGLIDGIFAAFQLVAVRGLAYCAAVAKMEAEAVEAARNRSKS